MPPIIHCVRHAQGYHNLSHANHILSDPLLTPHGESQCRALSAEFPHHSRIDLVVASPLRRTLYTALLSFEDQIKSKGLKIVALPEIQETSDVPCDVGSDLAVLRKEVEENGMPVDLELVGGDWNSKFCVPGLVSGGATAEQGITGLIFDMAFFDIAQKGKWAPSAEAIANRAREARRWLKARPEKEIVVVSHGGFLHYFTEDWQDSTLYQGSYFIPLFLE
ncbi:phosphoglycerate mutase [Histoplasma capsulatum H143]|uniref:Phosphoglycerate mutase n=1 Tax=Ajellomyces capsulatus (strain H143) TaxID=544712 RepID=C6HDI4_AJECH|nr:phosphoglycerate mutase [Histoplasma capsulatum H143]